MPLPVDRIKEARKSLAWVQIGDETLDKINEIIDHVVLGVGNHRNHRIIIAAPIAADGVIVDAFDVAPLLGTSIFLRHNGVFQNFGAGEDFTINGRDLNWLGKTGSGTAKALATTDGLFAFYAIA